MAFLTCVLTVSEIGSALPTRLGCAPSAAERSRSRSSATGRRYSDFPRRTASTTRSMYRFPCPDRPHVTTFFASLAPRNLNGAQPWPETLGTRKAPGVRKCRRTALISTWRIRIAPLMCLRRRSLPTSDRPLRRRIATLPRESRMSVGVRAQTAASRVRLIRRPSHNPSNARMAIPAEPGDGDKRTTSFDGLRDGNFRCFFRSRPSASTNVAAGASAAHECRRSRTFVAQMTGQEAPSLRDRWRRLVRRRRRSQAAGSSDVALLDMRSRRPRAAADPLAGDALGLAGKSSVRMLRAIIFVATRPPALSGGGSIGPFSIVWLSHDMNNCV